MSMFDNLVNVALTDKPEMTSLRPVVEKELLHHDILRIMNRAGLLRSLAFMGGTCLRSCYGSPRLSGDLDFTGDLADRSVPSELADLGGIITKRLQEKYSLPVSVDPPRRDSGNVHTWKIRITTRPNRRDLPSQRVNIDVQTLPARDAQPVVLRNQYQVDMGTMGLILTAESLREILADKIIAVALRPNRLKNRDIWDIGWLTQQNVKFSVDLLRTKLSDREVDINTFRDRYDARCDELKDGENDFLFEMRRFLPPMVIDQSISDPRYWQYISRTVRSFGRQL